MLVSDFNYQLPSELIAQEPLADRSASRLLHMDRETGELQDRSFREFPDLLRPDDLVVFNNTRVFPARLFGMRGGERAQPIIPNSLAAKEFLRGRIEVLLTRQVASEKPNEWDCLVRPGRKIGLGERLYFDEDKALQAEVIARGDFGERRIRFDPIPDFFALVEKLGHVPLPPYIGREDISADRGRYQTIYARRTRGSVAAPTAGLHFTLEILDRIRTRGIETTEVTLHVGLGTFQPVRVERVEDHKLHRESYFDIGRGRRRRQSRAMADAKRRIVAVGTTTVRTLEYAAQQSPDGRMTAGRGEADIFIYPGYEFLVVSRLLTNFHLPQSSLLMLVCAFAGKSRALAAYQHAVDEKYRFYSYGDLHAGGVTARICLRGALGISEDWWHHMGASGMCA